MMGEERRNRKELRDPDFLYDEDEQRHLTSQRKQRNQKGKQAKFYAVVRGRATGIFNSWEECHKSVDRFPSALFQGFQSKKEAEKFLGSVVNTTNNDVQNDQSIGELDGKLHVEAECNNENTNPHLSTVNIRNGSDIETSDIDEITRNSRTQSQSFESTLQEALKSTPRNRTSSVKAVVANHFSRIQSSTQNLKSSISLLEDRFTEMVDTNNEENAVLSNKMLKLQDVIEDATTKNKDISQEVDQLQQSMASLLQIIEDKSIAQKVALDIQLKDALKKMDLNVEKHLEEMENKMKRELQEKISTFEISFLSKMAEDQTINNRKTEKINNDLRAINDKYEECADLLYHANVSSCFIEPKKTAKRTTQATETHEIITSNRFPDNFSECPDTVSASPCSTSNQSYETCSNKDERNKENEHVNSSKPNHHDTDKPSVNSTSINRRSWRDHYTPRKADEPNLRYQTESKKLVVGDSLTKHFHLNKMFPRTSKDFNRTSSLKEACRKVKGITSSTVDTVIFHLGTNDLNDGATPRECLDYTQQLIATTHENMPNAQIYVSGIIHRHDDNLILNEKIQEYNTLLAGKFKIPTGTTVVRVFHDNLNSLSSRHLFDRDGVHLNGRGTAKMVQAIKNAIRATNGYTPTQENQNNQKYNNRRREEHKTSNQYNNAESRTYNHHHHNNNSRAYGFNRRTQDTASRQWKSPRFNSNDRYHNSHSNDAYSHPSDLFSKLAQFLSFMNRVGQ